MKPRYLAFLLLFGGCATQRSRTTFEEFRGSQSFWAVTEQTFAETVAGVDIFSEGQKPRQPYVVLGVMTGLHRAGEGQLRESMAREAKRRGGDGYLIAKTVFLREGSASGTAYSGRVIAYVVEPQLSELHSLARDASELRDRRGKMPETEAQKQETALTARLQLLLDGVAQRAMSKAHIK